MERKSHGLGSLISSTVSPASSQSQQSSSTGNSPVAVIPIDRIIPSPNQPRRSFDQASLLSLSESIRNFGLLQPVLLKQSSEGRYELVAGERRWRAAKMAGQTTVPALIRNLDQAQSTIVSIVENLQRQDLDPIEEASAYRRMITELKMTQEQVAAHVGKDRATIANTTRLLDLDLSIQAKLIAKALTPGHARVLLAVDDPARRQELSDKAANKGMSVRELERLVYGKSTSAEAATQAQPAAHLRDIEARLTQRLGVQVKLKELRRGGRLVIEFRSNAEFLRILDVMGVNTDQV